MFSIVIYDKISVDTYNQKKQKLFEVLKILKCKVVLRPKLLRVSDIDNYLIPQVFCVVAHPLSLLHLRSPNLQIFWSSPLVDVGTGGSESLIFLHTDFNHHFLHSRLFAASPQDLGFSFPYSVKSVSTYHSIPRCYSWFLASSHLLYYSIILMGLLIILFIFCHISGNLGGSGDRGIYLIGSKYSICWFSYLCQHVEVNDYYLFIIGYLI